MTDTISPSEFPSNSQNVPQNVGSSRQQKKKTNKVKDLARSKFDSSAPSISAEKFFTEFVERKRANVEIVFDAGIQGRLCDVYVTKAKNHAVNRMN